MSLPVRSHRSWGRWRLKATTRVLELQVTPNSDYMHEFDLEYQTDEGLIRCILHTLSKGYIDFQDMRDLMHALQTLKKTEPKLFGTLPKPFKSAKKLTKSVDKVSKSL